MTMIGGPLRKSDASKKELAGIFNFWSNRRRRFFFILPNVNPEPRPLFHSFLPISSSTPRRPNRPLVTNPEVDTYSNVLSLRPNLWDPQMEVRMKRFHMGISINFRICDKPHKTTTRAQFFVVEFAITSHTQQKRHTNQKR